MRLIVVDQYKGQTGERWTKEEDDFLVENHKKMFVKDMAKHLNRAFFGVAFRIRVLGLKCGYKAWNKGLDCSKYNFGKHHNHCCGSKNPMWRGGVTPELLKKYNSLAWSRKRLTIFKRDNYTCQDCKKHGGKLNCHHKIPYRISKDDSPDNLITLCVACHNKQERLYNATYCCG